MIPVLWNPTAAAHTEPTTTPPKQPTQHAEATDAAAAMAAWCHPNNPFWRFNR